jgi:hypothetical protein
MKINRINPAILDSQVKIIESNQISDVLEHVTDDSLVVFDLDDTLVVADNESGLGTSRWFEAAVYKDCKENGVSIQEAIDRFMPSWFAIHNRIGLRPVEKKTVEVVEVLQKRKVAIMGLTVRGIPMAKRTEVQLQEAGFSIGQRAIHKETCDVILNDKKYGHFHAGVMFLEEGATKGEVLFAFLEKIKYHSTSIVFVDDHQRHIKSVADHAKQKGVSLVAVRYGAEDTNKLQFSPVLAEQERQRLFEK